MVALGSFIQASESLTPELLDALAIASAGESWPEFRLGEVGAVTAHGVALKALSHAWRNGCRSYFGVDFLTFLNEDFQARIAKNEYYRFVSDIRESLLNGGLMYFPEKGTEDDAFPLAVSGV